MLANGGKDSHVLCRVFSSFCLVTGTHTGKQEKLLGLTELTELTARGATQAQYLSRSMRDPELIDIKPAKWRPRWRSATSRFCLVGSCLFGSEKGRSWGSWLLVTVCGCGRLVVVVPGRGEDGPCDWYDEQKGEQQQRPPNLRAHLHRERQPPMHGRDPRDGLRRHRVAHWQRCRLGG